MVNKRLRPRAVLTLVRRLARKHGLRVEGRPGRGKGSHPLHVVLDSNDVEVVRLMVPDHPQELSWTVLRSIEGSLAPVFGERWMEDR